MYFLFKMGIFQPAMFVYRRVYRIHSIESIFSFLFALEADSKTIAPGPKRWTIAAGEKVSGRVGFFMEIWMVSKNRGVYPKMDGLNNGKPYSNGMIWGENPLFLEKNPYGVTREGGINPCLKPNIDIALVLPFNFGSVFFSLHEIGMISW